MQHLLLAVLMLAQPGPQSDAPTTQPAALTFADRWAVTDVVRRPVVDVIAEDNPFPLYWAGSPHAFPVPEGVPVVGRVPTYASHVLGFWPRIHAEHGVLHGGTPIAHNLELHLAKLREQLTRRDAKPAFVGDEIRASGFICFDFESWPIAWDRVNDRYRTLAIEQIRERNPDAVRYMSDEQVAELTGREWERRANQLFIRSAEVVREIIPGTKVGYYELTVKRKVWGDDWDVDSDAAREWRKLNEVAMPTVRASDVLFPSIYNFYPNGGNDGIGYVRFNVGEARRLADLANAEDDGDRLVLPFVWALVHPSNKVVPYTAVSADDAAASILGSHEVGADGIAFWDGAQLWDRYRDVRRKDFRSQVWPLYTELYAEPYAQVIAREKARADE